MKVKSITYVGKEDVYNLEVEKYHNFAVASGLIVHNCQDALRYYCHTALPIKRANGGIVVNM